MNFTTTDYIILFCYGISFYGLIDLIYFKKFIHSICFRILGKSSLFYQKFRLNKQINYRLGRFYLGIFTLCTIVLSGRQLFQTKNSLLLLMYSFIVVTSLQIFWWNLSYNSQEDPLSPLFKRNQKTVSQRFLQAVKQLKDKDNVLNRIAGVKELEKLARNSDDDLNEVINILSQYIKNPIRLDKNSLLQKIPPDIEIILKVLIKLSNYKKRYRGGYFALDLSRADLSGAYLSGANLNGVIFENTILTDAIGINRNDIR